MTASRSIPDPAPLSSTYWAEYLHPDGRWYPDAYRGPDRERAIECARLLWKMQGTRGVRVVWENRSVVESNMKRPQK